MWIFTPDVAYNTDKYKSIWAGGLGDTLLHLVPSDGSEEDYIRFDCARSAIKAFDAVMKGLSLDRNTLVLIERYSRDDDPKPYLSYTYDFAQYCTALENDEDERGVIIDPRLEEPSTPPVPSC